MGYGLLYWATKVRLTFLSIPCDRLRLISCSQLKLDGLANKVLFLGYLLLIAGVMFLALGAIGFVSTYWFLRVI